MKKIIFLFFVFYLLGSVSADTGLNNILQQISENNSRLQAGQLSIRQAEIARELIEAERGIQLDASLGPAYRYSESGSEDSRFSTQTVNPGLSLSRSIPTGGSASLRLNDSISIGRTENDDPTYTMNPGFNVSFSQPLFVNGKFIDKRLYSAAFDQAENNAGLRESALINSRNTLLISGAEIFFRIALLRDQIELKEREIELETRRRLQEEKLQDKGRATSKDVWEKRLEIGRLMDDKWQLEYSLKQSEHRLAVLLNSDEDTSNIQLDDSIPEIPLGSAFFSPDSLKAEVMKGNFSILSQAISLENVYLSAIRNDIPGAVLSVSADVTPSLPAADSLGDVFSGIGDDDASLDYSLGVSVSIPLYNGGKRKLQNESDSAVANTEELNLSQSVREALNTLDELLINRKMLEQKLILASDNLEFSRQHYNDSVYYYKLGQLTESEVIEAGIAADGQELYQRQVEEDLYLNYLLILDHIGRDLAEYTGE